MESIPLNPENGEEKPKAVAVIDELACIGCTLCIQACPVDAILGASKQMHTVIESECRYPDVSDWRWSKPRPAESGTALIADEILPAGHH